MSAPLGPKETSTNMLFEAGELLREEMRQFAQRIMSRVEKSTSGEWATGARGIGRADIPLPIQLIESLESMDRWRLTEAEKERIRKYIAARRRASEI